MLVKKITIVLFFLMLTACSASDNQSTPQWEAAQACEAEAKIRIGDKTHQLDVRVLASSAKEADGFWKLQAPIVLEPGLRNEAKQVLECTARLQQGGPVEVVNVNFIY